MADNTRTLRWKSQKKKTVLSLVGITALLLGIAVIWLALRPVQAAKATPSGVVGTKLGEIAPDFTIPTLEGGTFSLAEQHGNPTIVFFMAYWCGTCIQEDRALAQLKDEYGNQLNIVAIDIDPSSTPDALAQFKHAADDGDFTWAFDAGQQVTQVYQVRSLDTTLILDENGVVVYRDEFPTHYDILKDALTEAGY